MSLAERHERLLTPEQYLASEEASPVKREYLNGAVYAMAGESARHSLLGTNITVALGVRLRGKRCRAYNSDMLVRLRSGSDQRFYYPDVSVICDPSSLDERFQDRPTMIFEVLSESTSRIDLGEKRDAYLRIPTLAAYTVVDSTQLSVTVWRRAKEAWDSERYISLSDTVPLPEIECELPLAEIYEGAL